jgi:hypothetical protein
MRRELYRLLWERTEASNPSPRPCPWLSDERVAEELAALLKGE